MKRCLLFVLFLFAVLTDQVSKFFVASHFELHEPRILINNILYLRYIRNPGMAFGMSFGNPYGLMVVTVLVVLILFYLFLKGKIGADSFQEKIAMSFILGGAAGNLIDRIRMREVIDFIDMGIGRYRWPVYNIADVYVTCGMILFIYCYIISSKTRRESLSNPPE